MADFVPGQRFVGRARIVSSGGRFRCERQQRVGRRPGRRGRTVRPGAERPRRRVSQWRFGTSFTLGVSSRAGGKRLGDASSAKWGRDGMAGTQRKRVERITTESGIFEADPVARNIEGFTPMSCHHADGISNLQCFRASGLTDPAQPESHPEWKIFVIHPDGAMATSCSPMCCGS